MNNDYRWERETRVDRKSSDCFICPPSYLERGSADWALVPPDDQKDRQLLWLCDLHVRFPDEALACLRSSIARIYAMQADLEVLGDVVDILEGLEIEAPPEITDW